MVQNSSARLTRLRKHQHITPIKLHWLPVRWRVQYEVLAFVCSALHGFAPGYIQDLVTPYSSNRNLRSADQCLLVVPRYDLEGYGRRAFSVSGPTFWNNLPENFRQSGTLTKFKTVLKTDLFKLAYFHWGTVLCDTLTIMFFMNCYYNYVFITNLFHYFSSVLILFYWIIIIMFYFLIYLIYLYLRNRLNILETLSYILITCMHIHFKCFIFLFKIE